MACDTRLKPKQTISERAQEVREAVLRLEAALRAGRVKAVVGPQGAIAFTGWDGNSRDGITDACAYRKIMLTGNAMSKKLLQQAEANAGRSVDRQVIGQKVHSHDGGHTWHKH